MTSQDISRCYFMCHSSHTSLSKQATFSSQLQAGVINKQAVTSQLRGMTSEQGATS